MKRVTLGAFGALALVAGSIGFGCGVDDSSPAGTGGTTAETSSGGSGAESTTEASGGTGGSTTTPASGGAAGENPFCARTAIPGNAKITDFAEFEEGDTWEGSESGDENRDYGDSESLTGGTHHYGDVLTATIEGGALRLTGTVTDVGDSDVVANYGGFMMWFGPCSDASRFTGVTFSIKGTLGTNPDAGAGGAGGGAGEPAPAAGATGEDSNANSAQLELQLQESKNYPVSADKGECEFETEDEKWDVCTNNKVVVEGVTEEGLTVQAAFTEFTGGTPQGTLDPRELLGIQWQFNCETGYVCDVNVLIDDIFFY